MKVTKTIELSDSERETIEKALSLIDQIADVVDDTKEECDQVGTFVID